MSSPIDQAPTVSGPQDTPLTSQEQAQVPADIAMTNAEGNNGSHTILAPAEVLDQAKLTLMQWSQQLSRSDLSPAEFEFAVARHSMAKQALESLLAGYAAIDKASPPVAAPKSDSTKKKHGTPSDLPLLQWTGNVFDKHKPIFASVNEVLDRFEDILESGEYDIDACWCRLLLCMLSPDQRSWFVEHLKPQSNLPWSFARKTIIGKYGLQDAERQAQAMGSLVNMRMLRSESVESYTDRFHKVRRDAGCQDDRMTAMMFVNSLLPELSQHVSLSQAHLAAELRASIDQAANLARSLYGKVVLSQHSREAAALDAAAIAAVPLSSSSGSAGKAKDKKKSVAALKYCRVHGKGASHTTEECRAASSLRVSDPSAGGRVSKNSGSSSSGAGSSSLSQEGKPCFKCGASNWSRRHVCPPAPSSSSSGINHLAIRSASLGVQQQPTATPPVTVSPSPGSQDLSVSAGSVPVPSPAPVSVAPATPVSGGPPEDIEMSDVSSSLQDVCSHCKSSHEFSRRSFKNTKAYYTCVSIQSSDLFAFVDPGASFSAVSPALVSRFALVVTHAAGKIGLAAPGLAIDRIGFVKIKLTHNNYSALHNFEVMDINADADISIGADLMPYIGIYLKGLAHCWHRSSRPLPPLPVEIHEPGNSPAVDPAMYAKFMAAVQPLLDENAAIPSTAFCQLPEAVLHIPTYEGKTAYRRQYDLPDKVLPAIRAQIDKWIADGVVGYAPPGTNFNNPLTFVPKRDAQGQMTKLRCVLDTRLLNQITVMEDRYDIPLIKDIFRKIGHAKYLTVLDCTEAFLSMPISPEDQFKTSFTIPGYSHPLCFKRAPFGLRSISFHYMKIMHVITHRLPNTEFYIDDCIIYSDTYDEHLKAVSDTIRALSKHNLRINIEKARFMQKCVYLLGFCVQSGVISPDPRKVTNVAEWPQPRTGKDIMSFLGLTNYFRDHIPNYAFITAPLDSLRSAKLLNNLWTEEHTIAFNNIKLALQSAPVLSQPIENSPYYMACDASQFAIGCCLYQIVDNSYRYIGFMSRSLNKAERSYSTTKRELLCIVYGLVKFHKFTWQNHLVVLTDHKSLQFLHSQPIASPMIINWLDIIGNYDFEVHYIPGIRNILPDSLSRLFPSSALEGGNSCDNHNNDARSPYLGELVSSRKHKGNNNTFSSSPPLASRATTLVDYITPPEDARSNLLLEAHLNGHFGADAIVNELHSQGFHWVNLKLDALNTVAKCPECQRFNIGKHGYSPLRRITADAPGDHWAIDLADLNVTTPSGNNYVLVMVDIFSRFCILRAIPDKTALTIAKQLVDVFNLVGWPKVLQSDNGSEFSNELVRLMVQHSGVDHRLVTPWYPRSNGVAEKWVHTMKSVIVKRLQGQKQDWDLFLSSAQLAINSKHASLHGSRPFSLMFARQPNVWQDYTETELGDVEAARTSDRRIEEMEKVIIPAIAERIQNLHKIQGKSFNKNNRILPDFPIGSKVMIVNVTRKSKTEPRYEGPFTVHGRRSGSSGPYVLTDETGALLSRDVPPSHIKLISQETHASGDDFYEIQSIVDHKGRSGNYKYRVRWKGYNAKDDTWEPAENFNDRTLIEKYWLRRDPASQQKLKSKVPRTRRSSTRSTKRKRT